MAVILPNLMLTLTGGLGLVVGCAATPTEHEPPVPVMQIPNDAPPPAPPAEAKPDPEVVALLDKIEEASSRIKTLKARVRYTRTQELTEDQQVRFGDFYYRASTDDSPTRFAVLFDRLLVDERARPMETWFIFDGNWLLERDHQDKTATRREMVAKGGESKDVLNMGDGAMPIPLKLKTATVLKSYFVKRLPDETDDKGRELVHLQLTPKQAKQDTTPLELWFNKSDWSLHKVVTEEDGDTVEMLFPRIENNPDLKPSVFDTALPDKSDGWQVQEVPL